MHLIHGYGFLVNRHFYISTEVNSDHFIPEIITNKCQFNIQLNSLYRSNNLCLTTSNVTLNYSVVLYNRILQHGDT